MARARNTEAKKTEGLVAVEIRASMGGDGFSWLPGDRVEVPASEAERLIQAGFAVKPKEDNQT